MNFSAALVFQNLSVYRKSGNVKTEAQVPSGEVGQKGKLWHVSYFHYYSQGTLKPKFTVPNVKD